MRPAAQTAFRRGFDFIQAEPVHVDQMRRRLDFEFHEVEKIGAAGDEFRARHAMGRRRGFLRCLRALIGEGFHAFLPATSAIASSMFE